MWAVGVTLCDARRRMGQCVPGCPARPPRAQLPLQLPVTLFLRRFSDLWSSTLQLLEELNNYLRISVYP